MRYVSVFMTILVTLALVSLGLGALRAGLESAALAAAPGRGGLLEPNWTAVVQGISYLGFILAMDRVLFRPMLAHLDGRKAELAEAEKAAEEADRAARRAQRERDEKLSEALREAGKDRSRVKAAAVGEYQQIVGRARVEADARIEAGRTTLAREAEAAERQLASQVDELAGLVRERLLDGGRRP